MFATLSASRAVAGQCKHNSICNEQAYQKCKDENITLVGGVAPTATRFAQFLHRKHKVYPTELWKTQIVTLGSVHGINTRYQPALHALFGPVAIRETEGGATECMFGQQRDEKRASRTRPNYDLFFFLLSLHRSRQVVYATTVCLACVQDVQFR